MSEGFSALMVTAVSIGFFHTLMGPDHYIPFVMMSRAGKWSVAKTIFVTFLCGIGHVLSSIVLGALGLVLGAAVFNLEKIESFRGDLAAWALIIFGAVYFIWAIKRSSKGKTHKHIHLHEEGNHQHPHKHFDEHSHIHEKSDMTPWVLFTIFIFGPCEPLIPILMYPAAKEDYQQALAVCAAFSVATISTMLTVVIAGMTGLKAISAGWVEKYSHALSGLAIFFCGIAIRFLGL